MGKSHIFFPNYVYKLSVNIAKQLLKHLGEHICTYLYLKQISSFVWGCTTALHVSKLELK